MALRETRITWSPRMLMGSVLSLALILGACAGDDADDAEEPDAPDTDDPADTDTEADAAETDEDAETDDDAETTADIESVTLEYANPVGEGDAQAYANTVSLWLDLVSEQTEGAVEVNASHGGSLLTHPDMMDGVGDGLADLGSAQLSIDPSSFGLWALSGLHDPEVGTGLDAFQQTMVTRLMMDEVPELEDEIDAANLKMLFSIASSPHHLLTRNEIDGLDDLDGLEIRTYGQFMPTLFESVGATAVDMPPDEVYTGMDRGVVDGAYSLPAAFRDLGWAEVASQVTLVSNGTTPPLNAGFSLVVNADVWDGLQDELKVVMLEAAREIERQYSETDVPDLEAEALEDMEADGLTIAEMSDEDIDRWSEAFPDLWSEFAADLEESGQPGDQLVDTYLELADLDGDEIESRYEALWDELIDQYR